MSAFPARLAAEFLGTFAWVFFGAGSICTHQFLIAAGQDGLGLLGIAVAQGLTVAVMVSAIGHISGGHINPAVTIGFWVTRKMGTVEALAYWVAQLAGGIAAAYLLRALVPAEVWRAVGLGTPALAADVSNASGILLEGLLTFFLVFVVFATAADPRGSVGKVAGFAIGLTVTIDILMGGPFTGAAMNPARALGPALAAGQWAAHGVWWVGPLAGGVVAAWLYDAVFLRKAT